MSERTQINGFTGEVEAAAELQIAPSPTDQRLLAANVKDMTLLEASEKFVNGEINAQGEPFPSPAPNYPIPVDQGGTGVVDDGETISTTSDSGNTTSSVEQA